MKTDWEQVRFRGSGRVKSQMVPGIVIGRGLAVTQFPYTDITGQTAYGLTLTTFGLLLHGDVCYFSWRLAVRCAEEMIRVVSFEAPNETTLRARIGPIWNSDLKPIGERYTLLDDLWEERRASMASIEGCEWREFPA